MMIECLLSANTVLPWVLTAISFACLAAGIVFIAFKKRTENKVLGKSLSSGETPTKDNLAEYEGKIEELQLGNEMLKNELETRRVELEELKLKIEREKLKTQSAFEEEKRALEDKNVSLQEESKNKAELIARMNVLITNLYKIINAVEKELIEMRDAESVEYINEKIVKLISEIEDFFDENA